MDGESMVIFAHPEELHILETGIHRLKSEDQGGVLLPPFPIAHFQIQRI